MKEVGLRSNPTYSEYWFWFAAKAALNEDRSCQGSTNLCSFSSVCRSVSNTFFTISLMFLVIVPRFPLFGAFLVSQRKLLDPSLNKKRKPIRGFVVLCHLENQALADKCGCAACFQRSQTIKTSELNWCNSA